MESKMKLVMQTTLMSLISLITSVSSSSFNASSRRTRVIKEKLNLTPYRCFTLCLSVTCDAAKYWFECSFLRSQWGNRLVFDMCLACNSKDYWRNLWCKYSSFSCSLSYFMTSPKFGKFLFELSVHNTRNPTSTI